MLLSLFSTTYLDDRSFNLAMRQITMLNTPIKTTEVLKCL